jgi:hypothetical protein
MATVKQIQKPTQAKTAKATKTAKAPASLEAATTASPATATRASKRRAPSAKPDESVSLLRPGSKGAAIVDLLKRKDGTTLAEMTKATGWQPHSVRGFLSGSLKKKLKIPVASTKSPEEERRYRIAS